MAMNVNILRMITGNETKIIEYQCYTLLQINEFIFIQYLRYIIMIFSLDFDKII